MRVAHNKFTEEKINEICTNKNLTYLSRFYDKEREKTLVKFICNNHQKYGVQTKDLYDIQRQKVACPYCNHSKLKETLKDDIYEIHPNIELLSEYVDWDTKIHCKCIIDGFEWDAHVSSLFTDSYMCKECRRRIGNAKRKTIESFISEMNLVNDSIEIIDDKYSGVHKPIRCKCKIDGTIWNSYPCNLLNKTAGCPTCAKLSIREKEALSDSEFNIRLHDINPDIECCDKYVSANTKIKFRCTIHDYLFETQPRTFLYKRSNPCPFCSQSQGEKRMLNILQSIGHNVHPQHKFNDCKNINPLRFDAFDEVNNIAFEYQGEQHYKPVDFAGKGDEWSKEQFEINVKRDNIKKEYCKKEKIPLIEIPYWEYDNMESFLINKINEINKEVA